MSKFLVYISRACKIVFCKVNIADICRPRNIKECLPMLRKSDRMFSFYKISRWNRDVPFRKWWNIKGEYCTCKREKMSVFLLVRCLTVNAATHSQQHKEIWMRENIKPEGLLYRRGVGKRAVFCLTHRVTSNVVLTQQKYYVCMRNNVNRMNSLINDCGVDIQDIFLCLFEVFMDNLNSGVHILRINIM
jgi:hypothetical protein